MQRLITRVIRFSLLMEAWVVSLWREILLLSLFYVGMIKNMRNNWLSNSHHIIDDNVTEISNFKSVKATSQIGDMCAVPVYNVYASCGFGSQNDTEYQLRTEFLPCLWLRRFGLTEEDARIVICHGDSMEDTLSDGDEVLVDTRELDHPVKHGVYVVRIGKHVYIKRLKYDIMAEGYNVISDNKEEYDSFIVNEEKLNEFAVIGKVVTTVMKAVI
ncbi:putative HTH-type transcriptional regulator [Vibrio crassostreae]|nr:putative HTH-type transcriptional regulator [Vibrio crassostreae]CAK1857673.1 putative HTH-type transcriptional regulator [Vibrio crassostreae]CAK1859082.1 putative HTH-type transcriptional regulator [Vibrio crassostreae]CAK1893967.1 putative HTH-type transcriptional regulator [Vibrio crassostreae]CAK2436245.1 putative HTH-type transcriptional regulator [Vibrio crassostreae]